MVHWFDVGVNLTDDRLSVKDVVDNAKLSGVLKMAITGTTLEQSEKAIELARQYPGYLVTTAGVHPHYAKDVSDDYLIQLEALAQQPQVVAMGECGLDFNRNFSPQDQQIKVFEHQLILAAKLELPVFLHERDAFEQQYRLLKAHRPSLVGGVVHCFTGTREQILAYLELGFYIGITGWLCDPKRGKALREAVQYLPLERILLETDAPYLMPKTLKSKSRNNEPANLPHIAETLAGLLGVELSELKKQCFHNSLTLFQMNGDG